MSQEILVATGGSLWSDAAMAYTMALAARTGAREHIVTVLTASAPSATDDVGSYEWIMHGLEEPGQVALARAVAQSVRIGADAMTLSSGGNVSQTILEVASAGVCDLLILGPGGLTGWKRVMLGSITNAVEALIKRLPPGTPGGSLWRRFLVATGGAVCSDATLTSAVRQAQAQDLTLCFLQVQGRRSSWGDSDVAAAEHKSLAHAEARAAAAGLARNATLAVGDRASTMVETAAMPQCDAIVGGSHGFMGWKRLRLGRVMADGSRQLP